MRYSGFGKLLLRILAVALVLVMPWAGVLADTEIARLGKPCQCDDVV